MIFRMLVDMLSFVPFVCSCDPMDSDIVGSRKRHDFSEDDHLWNDEHVGLVR
jgi:hypothetical protein